MGKASQGFKKWISTPDWYQERGFSYLSYYEKSVFILSYGPQDAEVDSAFLDNALSLPCSSYFL